MNWSYRIIRHKNKQQETYYAIHEVFYRKNGNAYLVTEKPIDIIGDTELEVKEIIFTILKDAFYNPVLDMSFFNKRKKIK